MAKKQKILIVRLSAIGDVIHSLPILHALKRQSPDVSIGWVVEDKAADIIVDNPLIDNVHILPKSAWKKRGFCLKNVREFIAFIKEIRAIKYDISIDLQELLKSAVISFLSGAKRRIAHDKSREFSYIFANEKLAAHNTFDHNKPIIERYLEPAQYLGAPINEVRFFIPPVKEETKKRVDELLKDVDKSKKTIVFSPATIWPSKHWVEEYWSELLDKLSGDFNIIFTGVSADLDLINRIVSKAKTTRYVVLAGKTNIKELIEVFNRTDIVIAPDTGPTHIANATEKPAIICIFGSTSFKRSAPYGNRHFAISSQIECQPCFKRVCSRNNNKMECVYKITPEKILSIIDKFIIQEQIM